jgi:hypothetical protein
MGKLNWKLSRINDKHMMTAVVFDGVVTRELNWHEKLWLKFLIMIGLIDAIPKSPKSN